MQRSNLHFCKPLSTNLCAFLGTGIMKAEGIMKQVSRKKVVKKQDFKTIIISRLFNTKSILQIRRLDTSQYLLYFLLQELENPLSEIIIQV